ncbi:MAG: hypothetical protein OIF50_06250 [Flavobacteriaceae bacterium]|nr:hypothetical protein [Flavobacteriaceae bacterium]
MKAIQFTTMVWTVVLFSSCASQQLQTAVPFNLEKAYVQNWIGGREEAGKGTYVIVQCKDVPADVALVKMYYKHQVSDLTLQKEGPVNVFKANFNQLSKPDMQMHADAAKEVGNTPPSLGVKPPYDLKRGEALLEYTKAGKTLYYILRSLEQKEDLIYNSRPKGGVY